MANKQYGLIIPKKSKQAVAKKLSVFDDDSEEEKTDTAKNKCTDGTVDTWKSKVKKKSQLEMKKVLDEDPTVYEYDNIYDDIQKEKEVKTVEVKLKDRKPKYIDSLLKAADARKKEYERRIERTIQKERENEGDEFKDKEAFVTSAYKKKMLEMQELEEKERREREAEEKMDVMKQKDLSGFYRHLLKQTSGEKTAGAVEKEPVVLDDKQESPERADSSNDNKQSSELIRAKKAIEELKRSSSENRKENSNKKRNPDSSDEEIPKKSNHLKTNREKFSQNSSEDSSSDESHKQTKRKHKHRHENSRKHKKSKHNHSDSEEESRHKKHKHSKHNRPSHRDDKQKRKDKHRSHREEKHKRNRHLSDSDSH